MKKSPLPPDQSSGSIVRQLRKEYRLSMTNLAEAVGISRTYLWQIEYSDHLPNFEIANKLASALGKTPAEIWSTY